MNTHHLLTCFLGFMGGVALPLSMSLANGAAHTQATTGQVSVRHVPRAVLAGPTPHAFGTTPATVVAIRDNGCRSFTISGPQAAQPAVVAKDDPRFKPCSPTANLFAVQWS